MTTRPGRIEMPASLAPRRNTGPACARRIAVALALSALAAAGTARDASGQTLAQSMAGTWAIGGADRCVSAPFQVSLSNGVLAFRDRAGKITREKVEQDTPGSFRGQPLDPQAPAWIYRRSGATVVATNERDGRSITLFNCDAAPAQATPRGPAAPQPQPAAPAPADTARAAVAECDARAANPWDPRKTAPGSLEQSDQMAALEACTRALEADPANPRLMYQLGRANYAHGKYADALGNYEAAARAGYPMGINALGHMHEHGRGVEKNAARAMGYFEAAWAQGVDWSAARIISMNLGFSGHPRDHQAARRWLQSCDARGPGGGPAPACAAMGATMHINGFGVPKENWPEAIRYLRVAATDPSRVVRGWAKNRLGWLQEFGPPPAAPSLAQAITLHEDAAREGNQDSARRLERLRLVRDFPELGNFAKLFSFYGQNLEVADSFDDAEQRGRCGFGAAAGRPVFMKSAKAWMSGFVERPAGTGAQGGLVLRNVVWIDPASRKATCHDHVVVRKLKFEEEHVVGGEVEFFARRSDLVPHVATVSFDYDWRRVETRLDLNVALLDPANIQNRIGRAYFTITSGGLDLIEAQKMKTRDIPFLNFSLRGTRVHFEDKGVVGVLYQKLAAETGATSRTLRREHYTVLEQWRARMASVPEIARLIRQAQDIVVGEGSGLFDFSFNPARELRIDEIFAAALLGASGNGSGLEGLFR